MIQFLIEMLIYILFFPQRIKRERKVEDESEHSDQREDGDENLVAFPAGNTLGSEYSDDLLHFYKMSFILVM